MDDEAKTKINSHQENGSPVHSGGTSAALGMPVTALEEKYEKRHERCTNKIDGQVTAGLGERNEGEEEPEATAA